MGLTDKLNRRAILGNIVTLFSGSIVARGMTALATLMTARQLGVDGYGQYAACVAIATVASILFSLGLDLWLLRQGGRDRQQLPVSAGSVLGIKAILGIGWMAGFFLLAPLLSQGTYPVSLLRWGVLLVWLDTLLNTTYTAFKAAMSNRVPSILEAGADSLWFGITVVLINLGVRQPEAYVILRVVISAGTLIIGLGLLRWMIGLRIDITIARQALKGVFPFASSEFLAMLTARADVVIIGLILGKTATGLYSPSVGLINVATLAPLAVYMVFVPILSNLFKDHIQQARRTALRAFLLSLGLGVILSAGFAIGSPRIITLLGPGYQGSVGILRILSLVLLFTSGSYALAAILLSSGQQPKRTLVQSIAAVFNLVANLLVINWLGVHGVAWVYVLTELIQFTGYIWIVRRNV